MKKLLALLLALTFLLCGCGPTEQSVETVPVVQTPVTAPVTVPAETEAAPPTTVPTVPTVSTEPEEPVYTNPLNGEVLDAPFTGRIFASTISNVQDALPHVGMQEADIYMEMLVNGSIIRGLALYTDIASVPAIGSVRSTRLMFNDIVEHYDAVLSHAGGSNQVLNDVAARGIDNFNIDTPHKEIKEGAYSYRDPVRARTIGWEHSLLGIGSSLVAHAEAVGVATSYEEPRDFGLYFQEDGTPDGEAADSISLTFTYRNTKKETILTYDPEMGRYVYNQYGKVMTDGVTGQPETFENVIIMLADVSRNGIYYTADFVAGGHGFYACNGQIIPILWTCDGEDQPFRFYTLKGLPVVMGVGNSYIGIASESSAVVYAAAEPEETQP